MKPNPYHLEMVRQGAGLWNQWRVDSQVTNPELAGADLSGINLSGFHFAGADLFESNLCRADLSEVDLSHVNLSMAYLIEANLFRANLSGTNLARANLAKISGFGADFSKANLTEVNLSGASLLMANLTKADLSKANLSQANLLKACLQDPVGWEEGGDDWQKYSSIPILTPALVHEKNLITKDMLIGIGGVTPDEPIPIQLSFRGEASYHIEKTLTCALIDVMKAFGFSLTGNLKVSPASFCATLFYPGMGSKLSEQMKESLWTLYESVSGVLTESPSHLLRTNVQTQAIGNFMSAILAMHNQLKILINTLLITQNPMNKGRSGFRSVRYLKR